jgi:5-(aminomethyl)-3-furanmethanol phosphate kinase
MRRWVVKLGGSLNEDPLLPRWLAMFAHHGRGRLVLVPGGGRYADEVRRAQMRWGFDDLAAHNMAVLAMAQTAYQWRALEPTLALRDERVQLLPALARGYTALWAPLELRREAPDSRTDWQASADTIAFDLAVSLEATHLLLVKSCAVSTAESLIELAARGVVDAPLPDLVAASGLAVSVLERDAIEVVRERFASSL